MKTITIQVGNSDDKLTQREWSDFLRAIAQAIETHAPETHFFATSAGDRPWQNACWVIAATNEQAELILAGVVRARLAYGQDSAAWTEGTTLFV